MTASPAPGPRSTSAARPAMARAPLTSPGRAPSEAGGPLAKTTTQRRASSFASTNGAISYGERSEDRERHPQLPPGAAAQGGRDMRALPCASRRVLGGLGSRAVAFGHASGLAPRARALLRRRSNGG